MRHFRYSSLAILAALGSGPALGHEFWIDPASHQIAAGDTIIADIRVGEHFEGATYPYIPPNFRLFELARGQSRESVEGRFGDRPALSKTAAFDGLAVVLHVTTGSRLTYDSLEQFRAFTEHKDASWALRAHEERGLPETDFRELYTRYAKSLIAVGNGEGTDHAYGLETEIVALDNPYTDDLSKGLRVRVLYQGDPRASAQVEVFEKASDGSVAVSTTRTDAEGVATVAVVTGRRYMLDAVVLREPATRVAAALGVVWESLWANLTFAVPDP